MRSIGPADEFLGRFDVASIGCCITDPPWRLSRNGGGGGRFDECASYETMLPEDVAAIFGRYRDRFVKGAHLYVFAPAGSELAQIIPAFEDAGWPLQRVLAWDRVVHRGLGAYRNGWEPVLIFSNGRARPYRMTGKYASLQAWKSPEYRTAKPWQAYRVFLDMSRIDGKLAVDPFCGLNPLRRAAESFSPPVPWASTDLIAGAAVREEVRRRARARHSGHPSRREVTSDQTILLEPSTIEHDDVQPLADERRDDKGAKTAPGDGVRNEHGGDAWD